MSHIRKFTCSDFHKLYEKLASLQKEIVLVFQEDIKRRNFTYTKELKKEITEKINFLEKGLGVSINRAKKILTSFTEKEEGITNVYGPEEIERAFGVTLDSKNVPSIPFTREELKGARERGEKLILRISTTITALQELMKQKIDNDWMKVRGGIRFVDEEIQNLYWRRDQTKLEWALVSDQPLFLSCNKTAPVQLKFLVDYLEQVIYKNRFPPEKYQKPIKQFRQNYEQTLSELFQMSIDEFNKKTDEEIDDLIHGEFTNDISMKQLVLWLKNELIAKLITHSPACWYYDFCLQYLNAITSPQKQRIQKKYQQYTRLFYHSSNLRLIRSGGLDRHGLELREWLPADRQKAIGVSFSRT